MTIDNIEDLQPNAHLFLFCPKCGKQQFFPVDRKSFTCFACQFRLFLNCAAAVIGLIFTEDNKICVTRRRNSPAKNMLDFPGGFADPGESIETCLRREIKEELNLTVLTTTYLFSTPNHYTFSGVVYDITDFVFLCGVSHLDNITARDDVKQVLFLDITELDKDSFGLCSAKTVIDWFNTDEARKVINSQQKF